MFTLVERDKRAVIENSMSSSEAASNEPYFSLVLNPNHHKRRQLFAGSPLSGVSLQSSEYSPSSSFSNGFCSSEDDWGGLCNFDSKPPHDKKFVVDELGLSRCLNRMNIVNREEQNGGRGAKMKGFEVVDSQQGFGLGFGDGSSIQYNFNKYGSFDDFNNGDNLQGFGNTLGVDGDMKSAFTGFQGGYEKGFFDSTTGGFVAHNQSNDLCSGSGWCNEQRDCLLEQRKELGKSWSNRGFQLQDLSSPRSYLDDDALRGFQRYKLETNGGSNANDSLSSPLLMQPVLDINCHNPLYKSLMLKQRISGTTNSANPPSLLSVKGARGMETFGCEDSFILQGKGLNYASNKGHDLLKGHKKNSNEISAQNMRVKSTSVLHGITGENDHILSSYSSLPVLPTISSLAEIQGYIYAMAQDQNGCRFLQRVFDEGTSWDVQMIFNEIISHVVELMLKPFGNYVIQKLLDVCSEEQRLQIVLMVTKDPKQLLLICLNTYGTRVIQKLIETVKTRQQISLVVAALKPGFLDLIKDQNGNHVIQRCLQCLNNEDNKFIFDAAAKFCVEIATHRHGCCVMQRCIAHSMGKQRDKLITEVSKNSLLLAQDPFGNYVVQYVIELKNPSGIAYMLSQFKGHYMNLSMQKFSSHVVEKCLRHFEESRSQIIHELLSVSHFEQLMQDPYANYVIQSALAVTKGPLHSALVQAVQPHMILRTSPYCKRIFSRNLLKK